MDWTFALVVGAAVAAVLALKRLAFVSAESARHHLRRGALVVDVRSAEEFQSRHLEGAVNIPLDQLKETMPRRVPDKSQALLLHCLSGGRSAIAKRMLRGMGYTRVFNLGSYGRAERIVGPESG